MTREQYNEKIKSVLNFAERNDLRTKTLENTEVWFSGEVGMDAIDLETWESPDTIDVEIATIVWLPKVEDLENPREREIHNNLAYGLTQTCMPDFALGEERGIVKGVMYCVL